MSALFRLGRRLVLAFRHAPLWVARAALVVILGPAPGARPRMFYGVSRIANETAHVGGGLVKIQRLHPSFPNSPWRFNLLYLVSSATGPGARMVARLAVRQGAPLVWNQNGVAYSAWHPRWQRVNEEMASMLRIARHVVYQSDFCKLSADRFVGHPMASWEILYNAVDTERFLPAARPGDGLVILVGGTQDVAYRLSTALEVLARVVRRRADARMIVTGRLHWGDDPASAPAEARRWVQRLGIGDKVEFVGPYSQVQAPAIYQRAHLLLHCKYNDPSPGLVVEALAAGLPVVYSASGGVPELVGDEAGIGVPADLSWDRVIPPDPDAMAEAVLAVAADRKRFADAARQRGVDRFDVRPWLRRHAEIFERVLDERAG